MIRRLVVLAGKKYEFERRGERLDNYPGAAENENLNKQTSEALPEYCRPYAHKYKPDRLHPDQ